MLTGSLTEPYEFGKNYVEGIKVWSIKYKVLSITYNADELGKTYVEGIKSMKYTVQSIKYKV